MPEVLMHNHRVPVFGCPECIKERDALRENAEALYIEARTSYERLVDEILRSVGDDVTLDRMDQLMTDLEDRLDAIKEKLYAKNWREEASREG
jgi:DNA-dependent RNA polymerase auxiliary subunit epsilon